MIEDVISKELLLNLDLWISNNIHLLWNQTLNNIMIFITNFAGSIFIIIFIIILTGFLFHKKKYQKLYFFLISIISGSIFLIIIKDIIARIRPENALINLQSFSFPSGHSTLSSIISLCLFFIFKDEIKSTKKFYTFCLGLILYPLIIGFSRIYLNVHYLSDVIGGFSLAIFLVTGIFLIQKFLLKTKKINFKL